MAPAPTLPGLPDDAAAVACLHAFLAEKDWTAGVGALVTLLNQQLRCHRASLGWVSGQTLRLRVLSDGVLLDEGVALPELHQAMLESAHQQVMLSWPPSGGGDQAQGNHITCVCIAAIRCAYIALNSYNRAIRFNLAVYTQAYVIILFIHLKIEHNEIAGFYKLAVIVDSMAFCFSPG